MQLYSYWRSLATFRVRIALNLKGVPYTQTMIDLAAGHQRAADYTSVNPQMVVPALVDGGPPVLFQSMAILEYIEETHATPALLPTDVRGRARVRGLAQISVADTHPLVVPRVREYLEGTLKLDESARGAWIRHWQDAGLAAIESNLVSDPATGLFCHGDTVTLADICTVSQGVGYQLFGHDLARYPTIKGIFDRCMAMEAFAKAHPKAQPGAPTS